MRPDFEGGLFLEGPDEILAAEQAHREMLEFISKDSSPLSEYFKTLVAIVDRVAPAQNENLENPITARFRESGGQLLLTILDAAAQSSSDEFLRQKTSDMLDEFLLKSK